MLIGSYASVANMLDALDDVEGLGGVMLVFDDFVEGVEAFGRYIQPQMNSRRHVPAIPSTDRGLPHE
jgi:pyrimidine oxygenase